MTMHVLLQTVKYSSKQKHKIYVCNIPREKGRQELLDSFRSLVRGIEELDITMQKDQGRPGQNRGFCFLEMYNQAVAEEAIAALSAPGVQLCGMCVSPAVPRVALCLVALCFVTYTMLCKAFQKGATYLHAEVG
jgi:RNA recognition motif. (a.k.a. RRM, RBD, or RNP domain)